MWTPGVSEARLRLLASDGTLWAVLDACDAPEVPTRVRMLGPERGDCLWMGEAREKCWGVAPWLARVDLALLDWIRSELWDEPWGLFVEAGATLDVVRKHFHGIQTVAGPDGRWMYFRFYDPRVLPMFLRTATPSDRAELFGPVKAFWGVLGDPGARELVEYRREEAP